ncbi:metal-dependent hydrolase [Ralstonia solanacearum]|uniref:Metal-dependent hydrolase n=2 Tax=Ralstonia solanacearum TaxID=305 RepID=A0AAW5ZW88_RALSL|nr:metal-dependent hydrolase [Ralstonia solanacearum]MDB0573912.1 metal-dependent hydrolase [Ralstonia solanacearum]
MDNLTHALIGAALGQAGLKRKTGLGMAALMIGANVPDIDVLGLPFGENLSWRRGWTHGPLALLVLPGVLALALIAFDRWQARRGTRPAARPSVRLGWLLTLSYLGALTHPLLDLLNTYGVRCLMPFSERWFYGDTLFIVDPLIWTVLGLGVGLARRRESSGQGSGKRIALATLSLVVAYVVAMHSGGRLAEDYVARHWDGMGRPQSIRVLASPVPIDPFSRTILLETTEGYRFGDFGWLPRPHLMWKSKTIPTNMGLPAVARAAGQSKSVADFLYWSRFPFAMVRQASGGTEVIIGDARYNERPDVGPFSVRTLIPSARPGAEDEPNSMSIRRGHIDPPRAK